MVLLFKSVFKPIVILFSLILSFPGGFFALLIMGKQIDMPVMIGVVLLMGIAAKNAILLVEFAIEAEQRKPFTTDKAQRRRNVIDAVFEAVRERARPIVMTTVAMSAGMIPTALGLGEGAGFRTPMAIAVIGGLISSTVLSLMLVPVMYSLVSGVERRINPFFSRFTTKRTADDNTLMHKANNTTPPPEPTPGTGD
jgi:HAE1 family hydrophobic/amphiphilic exporter-1